MQEDLILDEEQMSPKPQNLWPWLRLEALLCFAILLGYYSLRENPSSWGILAMGAIGYLAIYFIIPYKREKRPESDWWWVVFSGIFFGSYLLGFVFKYLSWPGAGLILTFSSLFLVMLHLLFGILIFFKKNIPLGLKLSLSPFGIIFSLALIAILFRMMHWPMAGPLCFIGFSSFSLLLIIYSLLLVFQWHTYRILGFYLFRIVLITGFLAFLIF